MAVGSFCIMAAVMMALVQHDMKRLLGYHAVSQVGYMILGIGTANPIGIAGGLFHMLNNAIYKSCLFFSGGAVEKKSGTTDLDRLGGLAKMMPITLFTFLVASLAISGVPPFNGFASKWMIYQGIINTAKNGGFLWILWLIAAMFGSALTLASFMKLIHAIFLGQPSFRSQLRSQQLNEAGPTIVIPSLILALVCIAFGIFAYQLPLRSFIFPSIGIWASFSGIWNSGLAAGLLLIGIAVGIMIYLLGNIGKIREVDIFVGGEDQKDFPDMRVSGTEFYNSIQDIGIIRFMYKAAQRKLFDIYEVGVKITFGFNKILRYIHNGVLPTYMAWCLLGMVVLFYVLLRYIK
jgi:formate hydrogenlyase subunit 3/multisubunit Na+/H+ antiporter MnhD subunit